ncbi:hypothetical protein DVH24_020281 [Malus domestica]|uniref:Cytochrome P450 n=1 Tax=Malus domestica TaxID=3750 RepID=A0A498J6H5_MALDO|nr:hypothetical protein DVH24_020281 [Malus domestica]
MTMTLSSKKRRNHSPRPTPQPHPFPIYTEHLKSPFAHQPLDSGNIRFKFVLGGAPLSPWEDFQSNRKTLVVISIYHCPSSPNLDSIIDQFDSALRTYSYALVNRCFAFCPDDFQLEDGSKKGWGEVRGFVEGGWGWNGAEEREWVAGNMTAILGGTDPIIATLAWVLSLLLSNREALRKAQEELDKQVGREGQVKESDVKNLVYSKQLSKKLYVYILLRHSQSHMNAGRTALFSETRMSSSILANSNQKAQRYFDVRGQNFEFIPFGSGRRMCPGVSLALQVVQLTVAQLLHGFEIETMSDEPVDMTESSGITNMKATPLNVLLTPRLLAKLYEIN